MDDPGAAGAIEPDVSAWSAWRPIEAARRFAGVQVPWYVAAGWAIDLFLGYQHREHEDLEVAVPQARFGDLLPALSDCDLFVVGDGVAYPLARAGDMLDVHHQTWVRERATGRWRLDIFREPTDGDTWICRRDDRLRLPYAEVIARTADGIPYARPEIVLLFKAKAARPKDDADLAAILPLLEPAARHWLVAALDLVHPGHRWLAALQTGIIRQPDDGNSGRSEG
jgi:hypothetical protein